MLRSDSACEIGPLPHRNSRHHQRGHKRHALAVAASGVRKKVIAHCRAPLETAPKRAELHRQFLFAAPWRICRPSRRPCGRASLRRVYLLYDSDHTRIILYGVEHVILAIQQTGQFDIACSVRLLKPFYGRFLFPQLRVDRGKGECRNITLLSELGQIG